MSLDYSIRTSSLPSFDTLRSSAGLADARFCDEAGEALAASTFPVGVSIAFLPGISTRPLVIERDHYRLRVRIMSASCVPTYALARALLVAVARLGSVPIETPEGPLSVDELLARFTDAWADESSRSGVETIVASLATMESVSLTLVTRDFALDAPFVARLGANADFREALFERMRRLNTIDQDETVYVVGTVIKGTSKSGIRGRFASYAARSLMPLEATHFMVQCGDREATLERDAVLRVLGPEVEWISANFAVLPAIDAERFGGFVATVEREMRERPQPPLDEASAAPISKELETFAYAAIEKGVRDATGDDVISPILFTLESGGQRMSRLMAADMAGAEAMVRSILTDTTRSVSAYALVTEIRFGEDRADAICVEAGERASPNGVRYVQKFKKSAAGGRVELIGVTTILDRPVSRFGGGVTPADDEPDPLKVRRGCGTLLTIVALPLVAIAVAIAFGWKVALATFVVGLFAIDFLVTRPARKALEARDGPAKAESDKVKADATMALLEALGAAKTPEETRAILARMAKPSFSAEEHARVRAALVADGLATTDETIPFEPEALVAHLESRLPSDAVASISCFELADIDGWRGIVESVTTLTRGEFSPAKLTVDFDGDRVALRFEADTKSVEWIADVADFKGESGVGHLAALAAVEANLGEALRGRFVTIDAADAMKVFYLPRRSADALVETFAASGLADLG